MNHSPNVSLLLPELLAAQQEFPPITKSQHVTVQSRTGRSYAYDFAPLDEILAAVLPILSAHGLLITSAVVPSADGMCVSTRIWHVSGQYLESLVPAGAYGDCKAQGSAISYARRFSHLSLLNLAGQDDEDGSLSNGDHIEPRTRAQKSAAVEHSRPHVPVNGNGHTSASEPDASAEHPTEAHIAALANLALTECREDKEVYYQRIRTTMGLKASASVAPKLLTRTMSMAQYMDLFGYYRRLEAQLDKSKGESNGTASAQSAEPSATPTPAAEVAADPQPAASAAGSSSAPAPSPDDVAARERLVREAMDAGIAEGEAWHIVKHHRLQDAERLLLAAAKKRLRVA